MKRFRVSTLMLQIGIDDVRVALVEQQDGPLADEGDPCRTHQAEGKAFMLEQQNILKKWQTLSENRGQSKRQPAVIEPTGKRRP